MRTSYRRLAKFLSIQAQDFIEEPSNEPSWAQVSPYS